MTNTSTAERDPARRGSFSEGTSPKTDCGGGSFSCPGPKTDCGGGSFSCPQMAFDDVDEVK